ncbi:hypothetical protein AXE65_02300 [Ventosimonas gracilis]|uniref:Orotate phosphoribosyltransferase n=1 Tax=Ventosimonas gracilis TaxID=1680762 RepID=A0A139SUI7_9GAMM|nr:DUF4870 domain-containing protein [Ventosimonas gracilis]KXU38259.1 hypothetical protein AXE65_02300 [Ventosimonas gracilis]
MTESVQGAAPDNPEIRKHAMMCHFIALAAIIMPPVAILGPLIYWQLKKGVDPFVDEQGKESLNFQLNVFAACIALFILCIIFVRLPVIGGFFAGTSFLAGLAIGIAGIGFAVYAAIKINEGKNWRYPLPIVRLIK